MAMLSADLPLERLWSLVSKRARMQAEGWVSRDTLCFLGGIAIVFALEILVLGYKKSSVYRLLHPTQTTRTDIVWIVCKILGLQAFLFAGFSLGLVVVAGRLAQRYLGLHLVDHVGHPVLRIFVFLLWTDFLDYWIHRGRHIGWWWELHKAHHSAEEFNAITTARGHPLDGVAIVFCYAIPAALLGGSIGDALVVLVINAVHAGLTHSILPWSWGWVGRWVIYPPTGHRIHHSALLEHHDKNFGSIFPIWDHLFGTYYTGDVLNEEVGVDDNYMNRRGFRYDLIEPIRRAIRSVRGLPLDGRDVSTVRAATARADDDRAA